MEKIKNYYSHFLYYLILFIFLYPTFTNQLIVSAINPDDVVGPDSSKNNERLWGYALDMGNILLWIVIGICFIVIVYAGYLYTTSEGEMQKVEIAKKTIIGAGIGMGIAMFSLTIVELFSNFIGG